MILKVVLPEGIEVPREDESIREQAGINLHVETEVEIVAVVRSPLVGFGEIFNPGFLAEVLPRGIIFARRAFIVKATIGHLVATIIDIRVLAARIGALPRAACNGEFIAVLVIDTIEPIGGSGLFPLLRTRGIVVDAFAGDMQIHDGLIVGIEVEHELLFVGQPVLKGDEEVYLVLPVGYLLPFGFIIVARLVVHHIVVGGIGGTHDEVIDGHFAEHHPLIALVSDGLVAGSDGIDFALAATDGFVVGIEINGVDGRIALAFGVE